MSTLGALLSSGTQIRADASDPLKARIDLPSYTTAQRDAAGFAPHVGEHIWNADTGRREHYTGAAWSGAPRLVNLEWIAGRNAVNSADVNLIRVNSSNQVELGAATLVSGILGVGGSPTSQLEVVHSDTGTDPTADGSLNELTLLNTDTTNNNFFRLGFRTQTASARILGAGISAIFTEHAGTNPTTHLAFYTNNNTAFGERLRLTAAGDVGIKETVPGASLQVNTGAATTKGFIVKGAASQSANLQDWQNSGGTVTSFMAPSGLALKVGAGFVNGNLKIGGSDTFDTTRAVDVTHLLSSASVVRGMIFDVANTGTGDVLGIEALAASGNSGTTSTAKGVQGYVRMSQVAGTLTNGYALYAEVSLNSGTITNAVGLKVANQGGVAGVTNAYGVYIDSQSGAGTLNRAIYSAGGTCELLAGAAANRVLILKGAASQSANLLEIQNSAATALLSFSASAILTTVGDIIVAHSDRPTVSVKDTNAATDQKQWGVRSDTGEFHVATINDSGSTTGTHVKVTQAGAVTFTSGAATHTLGSLVISNGGSSNPVLSSLGTTILLGDNVLFDSGGGGELGAGAGLAGSLKIVHQRTGEDILLQTAPAVSGTMVTALTIKSAGNVGIGETVPGARLQVNAGAAATKCVIIKGAASQSGNLLECQDSASTVLARVSSSGELIVTNATLAGSLVLRNNDPHFRLTIQSSNFRGLSIDGATGQTASLAEFRDVGGVVKFAVGVSALTIGDAVNVALNATTGTKIGTATTQKLGFWNAAPVAQPAAIADADGTLADLTAKFNALLNSQRATGMLAA